MEPLCGRRVPPLTARGVLRATLFGACCPEVSVVATRAQGGRGRSRTLAAEWRACQAAHALAALRAAVPPSSVPAEARQQGHVCPPPKLGQTATNTARRYTRGPSGNGNPLHPYAGCCSPRQGVRAYRRSVCTSRVTPWASSCRCRRRSVSGRPASPGRFVWVASSGGIGLAAASAASHRRVTCCRGEWCAATRVARAGAASSRSIRTARPQAPLISLGFGTMPQEIAAPRRSDSARRAP